jgi:hypothetical protein
MSSLLLLLAACGPTSVPLGEPDPLAPGIPVDDADAPTTVVDCDGGADFETIGAAVAAADDGAVIRVRPCTYTESVDFLGKTLRIVSTEGSTDTIIQARSGQPGVQAISGEGPGTAFEGFTITGAGSNNLPAAYVDLASLRLTDVVLTDNRGFTTIYGSSGDIELDGVTLSGNRTSYDIAVYVSRGSLVASDLDLDCDGATYGIYLSHASGLVDRATLTCGRGWASTWNHAVGRLQRSTVEGGVYVESEEDHYDDTVHLTNDVISGVVNATWGTLDVRNSVLSGGIALTTTYAATTIESSVLLDAACAITADTADFVIRNNLFWGATANACGTLLDPVGTNDNADADPLFTDARGGDWTLAAGSPAIDAGPDLEGYADVDGTRNDIGVYGGPFSIGGGW